MTPGQAVSLTWAEFHSAVTAGLLRFTASRMNGDAHKMRALNTNWLESVTPDLIGAIGELAVAKYLNIHWPASVNGFHIMPDLGKQTEVKARIGAKYDLIVKDGDPIDRVYILVVGAPPELSVIGWMLGRDAMKPERRTDLGYGPCYLVPQAELRPASELLQWRDRL